MIRAALLDPKGQRRFANVLLAAEIEASAYEVGGSGSTEPDPVLPILTAAAGRPVLRRAMYPK